MYLDVTAKTFFRFFVLPILVKYFHLYEIIYSACHQYISHFHYQPNPKQLIIDYIFRFSLIRDIFFVH